MAGIDGRQLNRIIGSVCARFNSLAPWRTADHQMTDLIQAENNSIAAARAP